MHVPLLVIAFVGGYALCKYRRAALHPIMQQPTQGVTTMRNCPALPSYVPVATVQPQAPAAQQPNTQHYQEPVATDIEVGIAAGLGVQLIEGLFA